MQSLDRDEVTVHVAASPAAVYAVVSDVTRTPELSPEIRSVRWLDGASGPVVGARFEAVNVAGPRGRSWRNRPVVTEAEPGRVFAFARSEPFAGTVEWSYRLTERDGGTDVTEAYEVTRPITRVGWFVIERLYGGTDRRGDLRRGMEQTLDRLRTLVERGTVPS